MPTNQSRIELPAWLPWATTACLAALVACLGELWIIEKTRSELLREQGMLAEAALKGVENQLEAERIVNARELSILRGSAGPQAGIRTSLLLPAAGTAVHAPASAFGVVAWDPEGGRGLVRLHGLPAQDQERDYQLWLEVTGPGDPVDCGVFHSPAGQDGGGFPIMMAPAAAPGWRLTLFEVRKGGVRTLKEAQGGGSIVLASLPCPENISSR